ncbi:MAG: head maturation protease, ClpP-related [Pseudomonadota bacterium]
MSLRAMPELRAPQALEGLKWEPPSDALARWNPGVRASADDDAATVEIYDVIDDWGGFSARRMSGALRAIGDRDVVVNINSPGGSVFEGLAIYNMLREHPHKVTVNVMGLAASIASVIAMSGDEVRIAKTAFVMVHNSWGVVIGNRHDLRQVADTLEPFDQAIASTYADRAEFDEARAIELMDAETWIAGAQAVEMGLADAFMPHDRVTETDETREEASARKIERALAATYPEMSRRERRSLLASHSRSVTPSAGDPDPATPGAGELEATEGLLASMRA